MMRRFVKSVRRARALFRIRCLEAELQGQNETLAMDHLSAEQRLVIGVARRITRRELAEARQVYNDLFPPGERCTWRLA